MPQKRMKPPARKLDKPTIPAPSKQSLQQLRLATFVGNSTVRRSHGGDCFCQVPHECTLQIEPNIQS